MYCKRFITVVSQISSVKEFKNKILSTIISSYIIIYPIYHIWLHRKMV